MATATLSNVLFDTTGAGAIGVVVRAQLVASSGFLSDSTGEVITYFETASDNSGAWSMDITPLDAMEDPGAYYQITEGRKQWAVNVPTAGDYNLRPQIINIPTSGGGGGGSVSQFLTGVVSPPSSSLGADGDAYLDTTHANLYHKVSGSWVGPTSLTGPAGSGVTSVQGLTGPVITTLSPTALNPAGILATDTRLTNSRIPTSHAASHGPGGSDPVTVSAVGAASLALRPIDVKDQANALANAIMDGGSHPLSSRFASLGAAQAVFPTCTALTEQIDYYAIQSVLNAGADFLQLGVGTAIVHKALLIPAGGNAAIVGYGPNASVIKLLNGVNTNILSCADTVNPNPNVTLRSLGFDGNKANNTGAIGARANVLLVRCDDLRVFDVESYNANGVGLWHHGVTGTTTQVQSWGRIYCHDNLHWGLHNSNGVRKVNYTDITCDFNGLRTDISLGTIGNGVDQFTGGFVMDHSEVECNGIQCHNNGQDGFWIRNAFASSLHSIRTTQNGRHGMRILGMADSIGNDWISQGNGENPTLAASSYDIWWDGTGNLDYGVTARTRVQNVLCGPNVAAAGANQGFWSGAEAWAMYFDDNMTNSDLEVHVKAYAGSAGSVRFPTAGIGSMFYSEGPNAGLERVESIPVSGSAVSLADVNTATLHRVILTATCAITLPTAAAGKSFSVSLIQDSTGGRGASWLPGGGLIKWAGGSPPVLSTGPGQVDLFTFLCLDGVHWLGLVSGQDF